MLPIALILFVATSAFAAPQSVTLFPVLDNSADNSLIGGAYDIVDNGDLDIYGISWLASVKDLAATAGSTSLANAQAVAILTELSTGRPGDSCASASLINAYSRYINTGNPAGVREAVSALIQQLANNIDLIVRRVNNPEAARFATGSQRGCSADGRTYDFNVWDSILGGAAPNQVGIINEQYCLAKRLYRAFDVRNNNIGAILTVTSLPVLQPVWNGAAPSLAKFLASIPTKNVGPAAAALKRDLNNGVRLVVL